MSQKNVTVLNVDAQESILVIFGRNFTEKVGNQKLIFPLHLISAPVLPVPGEQETYKLRLFT